jgi:outer membrane protein assembly factor BamB
MIVLVGVAVAAFGSWYMVHARPHAGAVIDRIAIGGARALGIRAEDGGDRNFVELHDGDTVVWQAIVPTYAGRPGAPGLAWSERAVSVRVIRSGRAEVFAVAMADGSKLGGLKLAPDHGEVRRATHGPVTLTDHRRSYEIVSGASWTQLVAFDLSTGEAHWKQELGDAPVDAGGIDVAAGVVWVRQAGRMRRFRTHDGVELDSVAGSI